MKTIIVLFAIFALACSKGVLFPLEWPWSKFDDVEVVDKLDLQKYLGHWYEIAAIPYHFEKGCHCSQANYSVNTDGTIKILNACKRDSVNNKYDVKEGKAWVKGNPAKLQLEFFFPFDARYWVLQVDRKYRYAMVGEPTKKHLWILSRTPTLSKRIYKKLVKFAENQGFPTNELEMTDQSCSKTFIDEL